jgi:hypothetical protein
MHDRAAVINQHYAKVDTLDARSHGKVMISLLSTESTPRMDANERFVIAESEKKTNVVFRAVGVAAEIETPQLLASSDLETWPNQEFAHQWRLRLEKQEKHPTPEGTIYLHRIVGTEVDAITSPNNTLDRLAFSLLFVNHYQNPQTHFQQQIRTLDWEDYETIKQGWVYLSRTAFAKIGNALPMPNRLEFKLRMIKAFKTEDFREVDYVKLFAFLYDYLEARLFSRGRLLIASDEMAGQIMPELSESELKEVGFSDEAGSADSVRVQADRFRKLFEYGKPQLLKELNDEVLKNEAREAHFGKLFKNKPLPLILS